MAGLTASAFGEPIESSVCFFDHHRFDAADLTVAEQNGTVLRVRARPDTLGVEWWPEFSGIYVQPSERPTSVEAAEALLAHFTRSAGKPGQLMSVAKARGRSIAGFSQLSKG